MPPMKIAPAGDQLKPGTLSQSISRLTYDTKDVDKAMADHGVGDARTLLRAAAAVDDGDRVIDPQELNAAARLLASPSRQQLHSPQLAGYRWLPQDLDSVMERWGIGDAKALLRAAIAIDDGDRYLSANEIERAATSLGRRAAGGMQFSPAVLADVMRGTGVASATALLAEGRRHDENGDGFLQRQELEAAAKVISEITRPHDIALVLRHASDLDAHPDVTTEYLGWVGPHRVPALQLKPFGPGPHTKVLITAGVHGDEPCGPAAALLLAEQLLAHPGLRDGLAITIVPVVNPIGYAHGTRRNPDGVDINRTFDGAPGGPEETQLIEGLFSREGFAVALDLHSGTATRNGFWVLHAGGRQELGAALSRMGQRWPLLYGETGPYDLSQPGLGESTNADTLKGLADRHGAKIAATLEAPKSVSYLDRVLGEVDLVGEILAEVRPNIA